MIISASYVNAMSAAGTPEEAAKLFYAAVSKGLAAVVADALSQSVTAIAPAASGTKIAGWEKLVGGVAMHLAWESPAVLNPIPLTQLACFAPYAPQLQGNVEAMGVNVSIGVSVSASF
ncbi:UNVERIFIED_ORG: hypothetical protein QE446_003695 [Rhizobium sp. SORGH_AS260]|nr:hypothetical protein [Rhizobium sp. SORGH_AS_0285]MDP9755819.1 hypothetical protein [Rhizobium sp. SORGH_AS_0260]MDR6081519.1 hypothetical protein [Agrobacterium sp. SORGH_AS_0440]